ncbi:MULTISPECIES: beta-ketoacyl-ACP synthase II [Paenibacillus]|uniref:3-oxoacyl-[acyl-carrier-protein] synthase 2 n=1 Tax=Paenibacillus apis TaxID=1792174 RepID=A0A920CHI7_9BACL|nr:MULTISPECIES: beta-ketoacyl-ACP synthase II [Paenibacillus]GIO40481.1 3-oxoacyl-[acyl-carrier-protein] synthase 2 [Paenibacillus apis]
MKRVVVTGLGAVTPIGNTVNEFWENIKQGKVGINKITKFDTTSYKVKIAAEVKNFVATEKIDMKSAKRMELFSQYAVSAAIEAWEDSEIDISNEDSFRIGTAIGSGVGSLQTVESACKIIEEKGSRKLKPLMIPQMTPNMAAGNVAIKLGAQGKCISISTACATGAINIGEAYRSIQCGDADIMIAGGTESCITPTCVGGFSALTALSITEDPLRASIPFDRDRNGFVIGEGAGIVILEELEHAIKRKAKIYAELAGYACTADAYHLTSPSEDGGGAAKAMELAIEEAGVTPSEIDYINAHGTSTYQNDITETRAIKKIFKEFARTVKINSTKSMIGHSLGAAGGIEFIVCTKTITDGFIHQTMGTSLLEDEFDLNYMIDAPVQQNVKVALSNSFGFGGHNAVLVLKQFSGK